MGQYSVRHEFVGSGDLHVIGLLFRGGLGGLDPLEVEILIQHLFQDRSEVRTYPLQLGLDAPINNLGPAQVLVLQIGRVSDLRSVREFDAGTELAALGVLVPSAPDMASGQFREDDICRVWYLVEHHDFLLRS